MFGIKITVYRGQVNIKSFSLELFGILLNKEILAIFYHIVQDKKAISFFQETNFIGC